MLGFRVQRAVQRHHVAHLGQAFQAGVMRQVQLFFDRFRQAVAVEIVQLDIERLHQAQNAQTDAAGGDGTDIHALDIVGARHAIGDVPAALDHPIVGGDVIADQPQDHHHHMFGDAVRVAIGDLGHGDAVIHRRLQIGMVRPDAGGHDHLQLGRFGDALGGHVGRPERLGNDDFGVMQLLVELGIGAVLVGGHHQRVALAFEIVAQAQLAGDAAQQGARREVDGLGRRRGLAVGIFVDFRNIVAGVRLRIAVHRVVIKNANNLGHLFLHYSLLSGFRRIGYYGTLL